MSLIDKSYAGEGMYRENILDHFSNPRHFGKLENFDAEHREFNPLCGDEATIRVKIEDNIIKDIKFFGKGCAISMAATSMLLSELKGKKLDEVKNCQKEFVLDLLNIQISPMRIKCALLGLETLRRVINLYEGEEVEKIDKKICL